ncbi:hypothetical protein PF005_g27360 [Phytophthora fragariae]|uniref:FYVE-type domain-containing protein n=2 Tax=Phytophthora fragariae TaxID=53985 RepID=A0A6A3VP86_9STRA|nr:hypothetical protein PF003_g25521 [Phytophthora fragariae]KAE9170920.1 hypothetical protein PF005_g27360 [Phytophthora fragariae]KAE9203102.1 hypothetical protein PF002_g21035 [Phytophthora fragariae]KAE9285271.1 hypothetical protein PF008_g26956 [Phytophthora fragariae]
MRLAQQLPVLDLTKRHATMLHNLAETLTAHNIEQYNTLLVTKDGIADPTRWREFRRRDGVRIYKERVAATRQVPTTPQLLLLGTIEGKLEDIMYGVVATTDEAMKIKSACTQDGVQDSKVLCEILRPTFEDPFHHIGVKWRLFDSKCDHVSLDATGIVETVKRERVGYSISHSVAFSEFPSFEIAHGIERLNMSVCSLYRQMTPTTVECYVRGFFEFNTQNEMLGNLTLQAIASQWAAFSRKSDCALMKKLAWKMRKVYGWSPASSRTYSFADDLSDFLAPSARPSHLVVRALVAARCRVCRKRSRFMGTCKGCNRQICTRCYTKKRVCAVAPDHFTILEKKRAFCSNCISEAHNTSALTIAREEFLAEHHEQEVPSWSSTGRLSWNSGETASTLHMSDMRQRSSSISSMSVADSRRQTDLSF